MQHQGQRHTHFDVSEEADTLKNVASDSEATALASMVFPLPGGPNKSRPERQRQFFMKQVLFLLHWYQYGCYSLTKHYL